MTRLVLFTCVFSLISAEVLAGVTLERIATYSRGQVLENATEIVAYDRVTRRLFVTNASKTATAIDVLDISNPSKPVKFTSIPLAGGIPNSVAVSKGMVAVAVEDTVKTKPGRVHFFNLSGKLLNTIPVGAQPDMLAFTPDGSRVVVANEGEPSSYNQPDSVDPEGSVSIIDLTRGVESAKVLTADFKAYIGKEDALRAAGIRIYGPHANAAQDFEPEYLAISSDSKTAWVTLQENNALAKIDLLAGKVIDVLPLGFKDHNAAGNGLDASDTDGGIHISPQPLLGMYQPDGISCYEFEGETYLAMANEGDARVYPGLNELTRVAELPAGSAGNEAIARLNVTNQLGNSPTDPAFKKLYSFGGRSFSIRDAKGQLIYDSGDDFERHIARKTPEGFNFSSKLDDWSDDKGPEPEELVLGRINGHTYAFIGLERTGGIMIYDISNPKHPVFNDYVNTRNFAGDIKQGTSGDVAPEGVLFIPAAESPNGMDLLVTANEVSGTVTIFRVVPIAKGAVLWSVPLVGILGMAGCIAGIGIWGSHRRVTRTRQRKSHLARVAS